MAPVGNGVEMRIVGVGVATAESGVSARHEEVGSIGVVHVCFRQDSGQIVPQERQNIFPGSESLHHHQVQRSRSRRPRISSRHRGLCC